uniref:LRR receptor-like serine/threonine-protein kinase GSO2 n=1 Tax=Erigeron canadensis TaxID=72917 RepID=UPI001CB9512B|nr:LRR receptor-like serine/threonine-protein kinase GSO2 [Erigeron canadensis]
MSSNLHIHISHMFLLLLMLASVIEYVSCELPSSQVTTMTRLHELLQTNTTKWNSTVQNPCSWPGVTCTSNNSSITTLSLSSFSISSRDSWPSLVCEIETLTSLDLSNNQLNAIPPPFLSSCGGGLKHLNLSNNYLNGPLPTFQAASLQVLDLSHNNLFGDIDSQSSFDGLIALKSLSISQNAFNGFIPSKLGGDSMLLEELQLSMNSFEGSLPDQLFTNYPNLSLLDLGGNQLTGTIPSSIGELSKLQLLVLSSNNLSGEVPMSISRITTLKRFAANQNSFTGAIPQGITRYLSSLDLSYNQLSGSIPADLLSQPNLVTIDLTSNKLEGSIPFNVSKTLVRLRLGDNQLSGSIPSWFFGNDVPLLTYLEIDNNNLNGTIPSSLRLCRNLSLLDLSHNHLVGFVLSELGDLGKLQVLQLQHNNFSGEIPDEISRLRILVKLNVSSNSLNGSIPPSLSRLQKLTNLDLQVNNLSGELPDSFGAMESLLELQLGKNQLSGVIRSLPTKLQIALNLSHNSFEGSIPSSLSRLNALEVLDLSNNKFSGNFPTFLRSMGSLTQILVSNNLLTGSVPRFGSNVIVSIEGNNLSYETPNPSIPAANSKRSVSVGIIVASAAAVVVLMIVVLMALIVTRRAHKINDEKSHMGQPEVVKINLLTLSVIHRTNIDFTKAMEAVCHPSNIVSKTRFSTYYKTVMPSGMNYYVKKLNWSVFQVGTHDKFEQELEILGRLRNSSVMIPLAYTLTTDSAYLLYEFSAKGTLFDVLHGSLKNGLDWTNRYSIALGVANGLAFLHESPSGPIILLDLSTKTVILKSLDEPQIGDIELYKVIDPSRSTGNPSAVTASVGYVPPEYAYTMRMTMAGNVYSFGVILLELLTGKAAVSEGSELANWVSSKTQQQANFDRMLDSTMSRTSQAVTDQMLSVLKVALACINVSPEERPKMRSVLRMLLNARI